MNRKIILFELNEVPFRVLDDFCRRYPESNIAKYIGLSQQYITLTQDIGHLHPWMTWPSVHRGISNEYHGISDFGEDLTQVDREYAPIWNILAQNEVNVGVFGSLHSYPMVDNLNNFAFYVPDTFAAGSECFPNVLSAFQEFNLAMVKENGRNVSRSIPWLKALEFLGRMPELGITLSTAKDIGSHLVKEQFHDWSKIRRRTFQVRLAFDIFMKQLTRTKPSFVTFFTNHVASSMHRYWAATYPDDYDVFEYDQEWINTYCAEIDFTMREFDSYFARLVKFCMKNPDYQLLVATSMGQEATTARLIETQLYIKNIIRFMQKLGFPHYEEKMAMEPETNVILPSDTVSSFAETLDSIVIEGKPISYHQKGNLFIIELGQPNLKSDCFILKGHTVKFEDFGMINEPIQDLAGSTAYHIPEGMLLIFDPQNTVDNINKSRPQISNLQITPYILKNFSVDIPSYMDQQSF